MPVIIELSSFYLPLTNKVRSVPVEAATVADALNKLTEKYKKLEKEIFNGRGEKKSTVNIYVNGCDINLVGGLQTSLVDGDVVTIVPTVGIGRPYTL